MAGESGPSEYGPLTFTRIHVRKSLRSGMRSWGPSASIFFPGLSDDINIEQRERPFDLPSGLWLILVLSIAKAFEAFY